jgi:hypothetical protein
MMLSKRTLKNKKQKNKLKKKRTKNTYKRSGRCNSCGRQLSQRGGISSSHSPFIGKPWGPVPSQWPGMDNVDNNRNYLESYGKVIGNDPSLKTQIDQGV